MSTIAKMYCNAVKKQFTVFYANWVPTQPISLGDYGTLEGTIFKKLGNIQTKFDDFSELELQVREDHSEDHCYFTSGKEVEVNFFAKGSLGTTGIPLAKAQLQVDFKKENSVFFNAAGCKTTSFANKEMLGKKLIEKSKKGDWKKKYVVVTDLLTSSNATISVSKTSDSKIVFEASSPAIEQINLGDAETKIMATSKKNLGYIQESAEGCEVLLGLCGIRKPFLGVGNPSFEVKSITKGNLDEPLNFIELENLQKGSDSPDMFLQLGVN